MRTAAIFLDRDGVLNENRSDYVKEWSEFRFLPETFRALKMLSKLDLPIIVVTNQAGIGRGLIPEHRVDEIHRRMIEHVRLHGARIDATFCCPHSADEGCDCRKPNPGLLHMAAAKFDVDLSRSVMVGDAETDVMAGRRAGCRTVLVLSGRGRDALRTISLDRRMPAESTIYPDVIAPNLIGAVSAITALLRPVDPVNHEPVRWMDRPGVSFAPAAVPGLEA